MAEKNDNDRCWAVRERVYGFNELHVVVDAISGSELPTVRCYITSDKHYDDRRQAIYNALQEHGIPCGITRLDNQRGMPEQVLAPYHRDGIELALPLAATREEQSRQVLSLLKQLRTLGDTLLLSKDAAESGAAGALFEMGTDEVIDKVSAAMKMAYRSSGRERPFAPNGFRGDDCGSRDAPDTKSGRRWHDSR